MMRVTQTKKIYSLIYVSVCVILIPTKFIRIISKHHSYVKKQIQYQNNMQTSQLCEKAIRILEKTSKTVSKIYF